MSTNRAVKRMTEIEMGRFWGKNSGVVDTICIVFTRQFVVFISIPVKLASYNQKLFCGEYAEPLASSVH